MDINQIEDYISRHMPFRFMTADPYEFEDFLGYLFENKGFEVNRTPYSGDFGADLILTKNKIRTVVQIKRYARDLKISSGEVQKLSGAMDYYDADSALFITTSSYSEQATRQASKADIVLWGWRELERHIQQTWKVDLAERSLGEEIRFNEGEALLSLEYQSFEKLPEKKEFTVHCILESLVEERLNIVLDLPVILTSEGHQIKAYDWLPSSFHSGTILPGRKVEVMCVFASKVADGISNEDRVAILARISGLKETMMLECPVKESKGNCYLVTAGFGRNSEEFRMMSEFRDNFLLPNQIGQFLVKYYYYLCEFTLPYLLKLSYFPALMRKVLMPIIGIIKLIMHKKNL